ncbi:MAG: protein kinase, partial [Acidobacteriota bacterium]
MKTPGGFAGRRGSGAETSRQFGRFEVLGLLGKGGMGRVWRTRDPQLDRGVAVKEIRGDHPDLVARFQQEARAQARIRHPHVCTVYEVGEADGRPFIAMELLEGRTLDRAAPDLSVEELAEVMRRVAEAVHAAHRNGLLHRDIKPANIMIGRADDGTWWPWVTDFGLARELEAPGLTISGATLGTPSFMPPEQARGQTEKLDARADVYSLGATLYAVIAGRPPFVAETSGDVLMKVIREEAPPLGRLGVTVPRDLESIIVQCLEKDPERRYSGADALAEDLGRFLDGKLVTARSAGFVLRAAKAVRRHRAITALTGLAVVLAVVLGSAWWHAVLQGRKQAELAVEFDQEVRAVEDIVRHAFTAPLHDVREEMGVARVRLSGLEDRVDAGGSLAVGPGHAALGRGYLALHDDRTAREHLDLAWNAGNDDPEVAVALGTALLGLYRARRGEILRREAWDFDRAIAAAHENLRDPAKAFLEQGRDADIESPELAAALLVSCDERWQEAAHQAAAAHERLPWLYGARVFEGHAWTEAGRELLEAGDNAQAERAFDSAEAALLKAVSFGRSDPVAFQSLCDLGLRRAELGLFGSGGDLARVVSEAMPRCEAAATADPESVAAAMGQSALWVRLAEWHVERQQDPGIALDRTEDAARVAMSLAPDDSEPPTRLASAAVLRAQYRLRLAQDPSGDLDQAVRWFEHALGIDPTRLEAMANLGKAYWLAANWHVTQGEDPRADFESAAGIYGRAAEIAPESALVRNNLGATWYQRATWEIESGMDATLSLERAVQEFEEARALSPGLPLPSLNLAWMYGMQGEQERAQGRDPMPAWERAVEAYGRSLEIQPDHKVALNRMVSLRNQRALYLEETGGDGAPEFDAAVAVARESRNATPDDGMAVQRLGVALLRRSTLATGPEGDFEQARTRLLEAVVEFQRAREPIATLAQELAEEEKDLEKAERLRSLAIEIRRAG